MGWRKALSDYNRRLTDPSSTMPQDLLAKHAQLNAALYLDKHDTQVVAEARGPEEKSVRPGFIERISQNRAAAVS